MRLKSSYELSEFRIIANKNKTDTQGNSFEFIDISGFSTEPKAKIEKNSEINIMTEKITYSSERPCAVWDGQFFNYGGFARMNRAFLFGLTNKSALIKPKIDPYLPNINQATQEHIEKLSKISIPPKSPTVYSATMPININHNGKAILFTMMETSQEVHPSYVEKMNCFDEVWTATEYNKQIFINSGVKKPIFVIPLGVYTDRYQETELGFDFKCELKNFRFLSVFKWNPRKNPEFLIRSYVEQFSSKDDSTLILVTRPSMFSEETGEEYITKEIQKIINSTNKQDIPHIVLYTEPISELKMPNVYNSAHCFVLPSLGEGFGLPYLEAGSCNVPIIATNCSGHSDFLNNENSFLINPKGYDRAIINKNLHHLASSSHYYENQYFPTFNKESESEFGEHMRFVYSNYSKAKEKSIKFKKEIDYKWDWEHSFRKAYNQLLQE